MGREKCCYKVSWQRFPVHLNNLSIITICSKPLDGTQSAAALRGFSIEPTSSSGFFNVSSVFLNFVLFTVLMIGIQNNHEKKSIDLLVFKTIELPIGFIVGTSLIFGSLTGNFYNSIIKISDD